MSNSELLKNDCNDYKELDPVDLSQSLIKYPSITPDHGETIEYLMVVLESLNFKCQKFIFKDPIYQAPVKNLYARLGNSGKNLCFAGHTDVVTPGDLGQWFVDPFSGIIIDDKLYGRGTTDMKCSIACFISAITKIIKEQKKLNNSISLLLTGDEEGHAINGTKKVLNILKNQQEQIDYCLLGEPSNPSFLGEMIKIGSRGSLNAELEIYGKQGHVAFPELAHNPIDDLIKVYEILSKKPLDKANKYFQRSNLEFTSIDVGNNICNIIPNKINIKFNVRFNNNYTGNQLIQEIEKRLSCTNIKYKLTTTINSEAFINYNRDFCDLVSKSINSIINITPIIGTVGGSSDAKFIQEICPVLEFGLIANTAHQANEHVYIKDLYNLTKIYQKIIKIFDSVD